MKAVLEGHGLVALGLGQMIVLGLGQLVVGGTKQAARQPPGTKTRDALREEPVSVLGRVGIGDFEKLVGIK